MTWSDRYTAILLCPGEPNNKDWIFLKSTQKGLLKNVQDGISRPQGSREIQKTKVGTDLLDTL